MKKRQKSTCKIKDVILPYCKNQWRVNRKWIIIAGCFIFGSMVYIGFRLAAGEVSEASFPLESPEDLFAKGEREYRKGNYPEAVVYYRAAAEKGLAKAMNAVAWCYLKGKGVQADESNAFQWYKKAASKGHLRAMYNLGKCYNEGWGVDKDTYLAYKWYKMGAEKGDEMAQNALAWCYWKGTGVTSDKRWAIVWYSKAVQQLHPRAMYNLACLWEELRDNLKDDMKNGSTWDWLKVKMGMCDDEELTKTIKTLYYHSALFGDELAKEKVNELNITIEKCIPIAMLLVRLGTTAAGLGY